MIQKIFTVYDQKLEAYLPIFQAPNEHIARRTFQDLVNTEEHPFNKHPSDYTLAEIAEFADTTGEITVTSPMKMLCTGHEVLNKDVHPHQSSDSEL